MSDKPRLTGSGMRGHVRNLTALAGGTQCRPEARTRSQTKGKAMSKAESPDLDRAREAAEKLLIEKGNDYEEPMDVAEDIARLILNQRAEEAERCTIDCTCAEYWKPYNKIDPNCEAHDLEDQQKARAADLRRQAKEGK